MQLLVAPVSINALQIVAPILVGNIVPCSVPMTTSSVCISSCTKGSLSFIYVGQHLVEYHVDQLYLHLYLVIVRPRL